MVSMVYLSNDERDQLKKEFGRLSRDVPVFQVKVYQFQT